MSNDAARHDVDELVARVEEQMRDLAVMQEKRSALTATAAVADGAVEVTIDAERRLSAVVIDESYLEEFEFTELGGHIVDASRTAFADLEARSAALLEPLTRRHEAINALPNPLTDVPDFQDLFKILQSTVLSPPTGETGHSSDDDEGSSYPTVRR